MEVWRRWLRFCDSFFKVAEKGRRLRRGSALGSRGDVLRPDFCQVAGQFYLPLCDAYTASTVFDALTVTGLPPFFFGSFRPAFEHFIFIF